MPSNKTTCPPFRRFLAVVLPVMALSGAHCVFGPDPMEGQAAPAFSLPSLDGETVNLADYLGKKVVLLDFWASWCPPCRQTMPIINAVAAQYAGKDAAVFAVNVGETQATVQAFIDDLGLNAVTVLRDEDGSVGEQYGTRSIPRMILIGKQGTVRQVHSGYSSGLQEDLSEAIDALLAEQM